jgi:flavin-dependent dehydrogenase
VRSCEVVIVGGGISASAAAIALLRKGRDVTLLEKSITSRVPLGETLSPGCSRVLAALGLSTTFPFQSCLQSSYVRMAWKTESLEEEDYSFHCDGPWWHIDHRTFREWLLQEAHRSGAKLVRQVCEVEANLDGRSGWKLRTITSDAAESSIQASILVDATGRAATIARRCGFRRLVYDKLLGISRVLCSQQAIPPADWPALVEASHEGWWYSSAMSAHAVVGTFMTDGPVRSATIDEYWHNQLSRSRHTNFRLAELQPASEVWCLSAATIRTNPIATSNLFTVGDAAFTQNPLSSQGIQKALTSGYDAGIAINEVLEGRRATANAYANEMTTSFSRYLSVMSLPPENVSLSELL